MSSKTAVVREPVAHSETAPSTPSTPNTPNTPNTPHAGHTSNTSGATTVAEAHTARSTGRRVCGPAPVVVNGPTTPVTITAPATTSDLSRVPTPANSPPGPTSSPSARVAGRRKEADARPRGPRVRMRLPDGQDLEVTLVSWHQYRDGTWRARVRWPVWGAYGSGTEVETKAWAMESFVPVSVLGTLDGEDYRSMRRDRARIQVPKQQ